MIVGSYVKTFREADMGMLEGASLNAPYAFHWVYITKVERDHIVCTGAGKELRLPFKKVRGRDWARVTITDPIFGPITFKVAPFLRTGGVPAGKPD